MSKKNLDDIINNLNNAKKYIRKAGDSAREAGDKSGQVKIEKKAAEVEQLEKEFGDRKEGR